MKKILLSSLIAAAFVAPQAFAQSASFQGFYGQIGIGADNHDVSNNNLVAAPTGASAGLISDSVSKTKFGAKIDLGYNFDVNDMYFVGLGIEYNPMRQNIGTAGLRATGGTTVLASNMVKTRNQYSIYVAPGRKLDASSAIYGKIGYSSENVKLSSTIDGSTTLDTNLDGWMLGLGYKKFTSANLYWFGELSYADLRKKGVTTSDNTLRGDGKDKAFGIFVGAGYKF